MAKATKKSAKSEAADQPEAKPADAAVATVTADPNASAETRAALEELAAAGAIVLTGTANPGGDPITMTEAEFNATATDEDKARLAAAVAAVTDGQIIAGFDASGMKLDINPAAGDAGGSDQVGATTTDLSGSVVDQSSGDVAGAMDVAKDLTPNDEEVRTSTSSSFFDFAAFVGMDAAGLAKCDAEVPLLMAALRAWYGANEKAARDGAFPYVFVKARKGSFRRAGFAFMAEEEIVREISIETMPLIEKLLAEPALKVELR